MSDFGILKTYRPRSLVYEGFLNGLSVHFCEEAFQMGFHNQNNVAAFSCCCKVS